MDTARFGVILIIGVMAFAVRAVPQVYLVGRKFPPEWDRFLRYVSYALICSMIGTTLFISGGGFQSRAAPYRAAALAVTIAIARRTKSALAGMLTGAALISALSWLAAG